MHGHGFQVVAYGAGSFDDAALAQANSVDLHDVIVRDTVVVPANGWMVTQFVFPQCRTVSNMCSHASLPPTESQPTIRVCGLCTVTLVSCCDRPLTTRVPFPSLPRSVRVFVFKCGVKHSLRSENVPCPVAHFPILSSLVFPSPCRPHVMCCGWTTTRLITVCLHFVCRVASRIWYAWPDR